MGGSRQVPGHTGCKRCEDYRHVLIVLTTQNQCIAICESELDQHLKEIRKFLKRPSLTYVTISAIEVSLANRDSRTLKIAQYLVEVPVRDAKSVPPKWVKISSTKSVIRFHTPEVLRM